MTITLQAVNELIASLESAGELSIREQKFLKLAQAYQQLAAENVGLKKFIKTECFVGQDKPDICLGLVSTRYVSADGYEPETPATDRIMAESEALKSQVEQLAAENVGMDGFVEEMLAIAWQEGSTDGSDIQELALKHGLIRQEVYCADKHENCVYDPGNFDDGDAVYFRTETPATDTYLAGIKADGVESGIKTIMTMLNHQAPGVSDAINVLRVHSSELREGADK